ncbi:MAG TPA: cytochrome o ubiquinol oxidase subunit III [Rhizobiaceae bacterium]|jgi:cytochrome o ubiquinol oxidase subunit 3|nr:cytochrome o ubiquinol oxidase subunit III [Rhizobiaceae bacterium]
MTTETALQTAGTPAFYVTEEEHPHSSTLLGFWIYIMSDTLIFAVLFATFGVLRDRYAGGPTPQEVLEIPTVALNTAMLLISSITCGFAMLEMVRNRKAATLFWLLVTGLFGAAFVGLELREFFGLVAEGAGPQRSAYLSAFFTLVGTHGTHVTIGIIWLITLMVQIARKGLIHENTRRLMCFSMFWHFLDVIWIGVFSVVYLLGVL